LNAIPSQCYPPGLIERFRNHLPLDGSEKPVSLGEGGTPLLSLPNLARKAGIDMQLFAKFEGMNPTGSFKDRGMCLAVTKAVAQGARGIICASTGNTSASAAAYAARANIPAFVLIPAGRIAMGKLTQTVVYGAHIMQLEGNFDDGMRLVRQLAQEDFPVAVVNSVNPFRLQGQKTAAFEILEALGKAPDYHCLPVGNAGNISAYWMGYSEWAPNYEQRRPVMIGYQAEGSAPFVRGHMVDHPETVATAIRIGHPQSWDLAQRAREESGGWFDAVSDEQILSAQSLLAATEGIFCEPASAASIAGMLQDYASGRIRPGATVVCTLTGNGLKDTDSAMQTARFETRTMKPELNHVRRLLSEVMQL